MFLQLLNKFLYYPPDTGSGVADKSSGSGTGNLSKDDIIDFLGEDDDDSKDEVLPLKDDKKDDKDDKKDKTKDKEDKEDDDDKDDEEKDEDEDVDELDELEDELDEPNEEKLELSIPSSRREILKKYPKLFKDFPGLETAYYREQEFTKLLPTIAEAKEAVEKSQTLDNLERDFLSGNTETILKAVKDNNPKAFNKLVDNYLDTLGKVDKEASHHIIANTIKHTIQAMVHEARTSGNDALESAAVILNQFMFASSKWTPPSKLSTDDKTEDTSKEDKISERERNLVKQQFTKANTELTGKVNRIFKATIEGYIDPRKSMPDYVRKNATRDALEELDSLINKDTRFKTLIDKLWDRAIKNDFDGESMNKLERAFKSKAGTLMSSVIKKARNEALRGMGSRSRDKDDDSHPEKDESKRGDESRRRNDSKKGGESHRRNDSDRSGKVPDGMSSLEYLMSED